MSKMTRLNPQKIFAHQAYRIDELAAVYGINKKTCLRWIDEGLKTVPGRKKPILMRGGDIKTFIRQKNSKRKFKLEPNEFNCLKCKAPRRAKRGTITESGDTRKGICRVCNSKMTRKIKPYQKDYSIPSIPVQMSTLFDDLT